MKYIKFFFNRNRIVFLFILRCVHADAQTFFAQKQSTVDSFQVIVGNVDLYYNVVLNGGSDTTNDIHDLTPLKQLKVLTGGLYILNTTRLKSLHGLDSLEYVGGLLITNNDSLKDLSGLNPRYVYTDYVEISQNKGLEAINGLNRHEDAEDFRIFSNPKLKVVDGLESLKKSLYLYISENDLLEHISIPNFRTGTLFWFSQNKNLLDISFPNLDTLQYFQPSFTIWKCPRLKNLDGIHPKYATEQTALWLIGNDSLQDIKAVSKWPASIMGFRIIANKALDSINLPNIKKTVWQVIGWNNTLRSINLPNLEVAQYGSGAAVTIFQNPNLTDISMPKLKTITYVKDTFGILNCPKLSSVSGFGSLENVNGRILLRGLNRVKSLHGFEKLRYCGAGFEIGSYYSGGMDSLENLCPFQQFEYTRLDLQFLNCPRLSSLAGLETFRRTGALNLAWLDSLKNLHGLMNLDTLKSDSLYTSGWIRIDSIGAEDISGIKNIQEFGSEATIRFMNSHLLKNIAFTNLTKGDELWVRDCEKLEDIQLPALTKLQSINYPVVLFLERLPSLHSLDGLENLKTFKSTFYPSSSFIRIKKNPALTDCDAICKMRETIAASFFNIQENAFPCSSLPEIEDSVCNAMSRIFDPAIPGLTDVRISPNPAQDAVELWWPGFPADAPASGFVTLVSSAGQIVFTQKISSERSLLDVSQIPSGLYFLQLNFKGKKAASGKIAVMR